MGADNFLSTPHSYHPPRLGKGYHMKNSKQKNDRFQCSQVNSQFIKNEIKLNEKHNKAKAFSSTKELILLFHIEHQLQSSPTDLTVPLQHILPTNPPPMIMKLKIFIDMYYFKILR